MTTIHTAVRVASLGLAISLLGTGLLIGSVHPSSASEITPTPVSAQQSSVPDIAKAVPGTAPASAAPAEQAWPPLGAAGFGWG